MENIVIDRSGSMKSGCFYELAVLQDERQLSLERSKTPKLDIVSLHERVEGKAPKSGKPDYIAVSIGDFSGADAAYDCQIDKTHRTASYWKNLKVELSSGTDLPDLIYGDMEGSRTLIVPERMAKRLQASPFRGYQLVEITEVDDSRVAKVLPVENRRLYELQFRGKACRRGFSVVGAPNACPHCGRTPLICPGCGYYKTKCPDCGKEGWIAKKNHQGAGDKRLIPAGWDQWSPEVIDVNRWDGSDFVFVTLDAGLRTNIVTKRVVDWLLSIHAAPFVARPVEARLDGASPEQLKMLEEAKGK